MNIKGLNSSPISPLENPQRIEGQKRMREAADRDGNGRQESGEHETKRHLNQQEFDEAVEILKNLPGLKANNLTIKVETKEDCRVILILDPHGQIVRRLSESQLWASTRDKDRQTGKILDKAM
jgi:hypothetical protein